MVWGQMRELINDDVIVSTNSSSNSNSRKSKHPMG
jgi:hypothetical protein